MPKVFNFRVIIEQDEDGLFIANVPAIPGCHTQAKTYEAVIARIREAIELCLAVAKEDPTYKARITFPKTARTAKFKGTTNLPVSVSF